MIVWRDSLSLSEALDDNISIVRINAETYLINIGGPLQTVLPVLLELARDEDADIAVGAIFQLEEFGSDA